MNQNFRYSEEKNIGDIFLFGYLEDGYFLFA